MLKKIICFLLCMALTAALCGCRDVGKGIRTSSSEVSESSSESSSEPEPSSSSEPDPVEPPKNISFVCAGDNLIHDTLYQQANARAGYDGYDFDFAYEEIEDLIKGHQIAVLNQETIIASPPFACSSYPCFSSPQEVALKMLDIGFNSFNHANNHVLDKGTDGIEACLDFWDTQYAIHDIAVTGVWRNTEDMENIKTITKDGVTFAFLGFTEWLNGLSLPSGAEERIVTTDEEAEMERLVRMADEIADVVIVSVHWGIEDSNIVVDYQTELARKFVDWGVDVIIGTHPHVLQSMEYIMKDDGTQALCIYSLGNFISAQHRAQNLIGGVVTATIVYDPETDTVNVKDTEMHPTVTHYGYGSENIKVYELEDYTEELAAVHGAHSFLPGWSLDYIWGVVDDVIPQCFLPYHGFETENDTAA